MKKVLGDLCLFLLVANFFMLWSNTPFFRRSFSPPQGYRSTYVHDWQVDYFTYLYFIRASRDGAWSITDPYTTETTAGTGNYAFYIALGKIARITGLSPTAAYHIARFVSFELFAVAFYITCLALAGERLARTGALLGFLSAPIVLPLTAESNPFPVPWIYQNPIYRTDMLPHHSFGAFLMLATVILYLHYLKRPERRILAALAVMPFLATVVHPVSALMAAVIVPVSIALDAVRRNFRNILRSPNMAPAVVMAASAMTAMVWVKSEVQKGFPWELWSSFDVRYFNTMPDYDVQFTTGAGILLFLAIPPALYVLLRPSAYRKILLVAWFFVPYALLPLSTMLSIAKFRMAFLFPVIPMGILAAYGMNAVVRKIRYARLKMPAVAGFAAAFLAASVPSTLRYYESKSANYASATPVAYLSVGEAETMAYLDSHANPGEAVLASDNTSLVLPAYAGTKVFTGHFLYTKDYIRKTALANAFFSGQMDRADALRLIRINNITKIFYGKYEHTGYDILRYGIPMGKYFQNAEVTVYRIL